MAEALRVLVVDDDDVARECVQRSLARVEAPTEMVPARDGLEALSILRGEHPHLAIAEPLIVLLDLNMPRMNGCEFLDALRNDEALRDCTVYVLTSSTLERDRALAEERGVAGFLPKTGGPALTQHLRALLRS